MEEKEIIKAQDRLDVLAKMEEYERKGWFDKDLENDPPSITLMPDKVDYLRKKPSSKIKRTFYYYVARRLMKKLIKTGVLRVKNIIGIENYQNLNSGAILTCNHFNALDSFANQLLYDKSGHKKRKLYKIVREGNYTNFPGVIGKIFKHCNTLPLSSNLKTMQMLFKSVKVILDKGNFILVYAEQGMWWNYRKPRPLKKGAFQFAVNNNVPVLPIFITMEDSKDIGPDGFPIQEYTIHVEKPIYADPTKSARENVEEMQKKNFEVWKNIYETTYGIPLEYSTEQSE